MHFLVRIKHDSRTFSYLKISSSGVERLSTTILEYKLHIEVQNAGFSFEVLNRPYQV